MCVTQTASTCQRDLDCNPPDLICQDHACKPGCTLTCCFGGTLCNQETGYCETNPSSGCRNDHDCDPPATTCVDGRCLTPKTCMGDADCKVLGKVCQGGACLDGCDRVGCGPVGICDPVTLRCHDGGLLDVVEPKAEAVQATDTETEAESVTVPDTATLPDSGPTGCTNDSNCNVPVTICEGHQCVPGCGSVPCGVGEQCDLAIGRCKPKPATCTSDADCAPPDTVCQGTTCVDGCGSAGCPPPGTCNALSGHCQGLTPLGETCSHASDCQSGTCIGVALKDGSTRQLCVTPCCTGSECYPGFGCMAITGVKFCLPASLFPGYTFQVADGGSCTNAGQCQSGMCELNKGRCVGTCCQTPDCLMAPLHTCQLYLAGNNVEHICDLDPVNYALECSEYPYCSVPVGGPCQSYAECQSLNCDDAYPDAGHLCADLCCSNQDCPAGTACRMYTQPFGAASVYAAMCLKEGEAALGSPCVRGSECAGGDCVGGTCRRLCCQDADCPVGECQLDIKQDANSGLETYVTVCL
jgi:hypothetical protein